MTTNNPINPAGIASDSTLCANEATTAAQSADLGGPPLQVNDQNQAAALRLLQAIAKLDKG